MSRNGAATGMRMVMRAIRSFCGDRGPAHSACAGAAAGSTVPGTAKRHTVTAVPLRTVLAVLASALLSFQFNDNHREMILGYGAIVS